MATRTEPCRVSRFFIFNPLRFGLYEDNDTEKVLYFWPHELPLEKKMADVGLVEALTNFAETFTTIPTSTCQTEKVRYILQRPELGWWVVMVVQNPRVFNIETKESVWHGEWLDEVGLQNILIHHIARYRLFNGSFENMLATLGEKELRATLPKLWNPIVCDIEPEKGNIFSSLDVWSGLEQDDMLKIYKYLISINKFDKPQTQNDVLQVDESISIYLGPNLTQYQLVIIRMNDCFCLFVVTWENTQVKNTFLSQLNQLINLQLVMLAKVIGEHAKKNIIQTDDFQYLYFNHMNLAIKNTLVTHTITPDVFRVLNQMHADFKRDDKLHELIIGTLNEGWIAGRKADQREFYVYFDQKSAHLLEINEEVKKLTQTYFKDIFID